MPIKDLHDKPFDEETLAKLDIFEAYAQAWLPTFVWSDVKNIRIIDFFAGTGYDKRNVPGSPIRILQVIKQYAPEILKRKIKVKVFFNEYNATKFEQLKQACEQYIKDNDVVKRAAEIEYLNLDFDVCFTKLLPEIKKYPSLIYLDQNGIKAVADKYFLELEKTDTTDFLYFISSSYFWRFGDKDEFKAHFKLDMAAAKKDPYQFIHRSLLKQLSNNLPKDSKLTLYPFSLKKGANIHGIIFGAKHPRAVEKFLDIAWKMNSTNGEANFDIDEDGKKVQLDLYEDKKPTKLEVFEKSVKELIKNKKIINNSEVYLFTLANGYTPKHATATIKDLKKQKLVYYNSTSPKINYDSLKDKSNLLEIKWTGNEAI